MSAFIAYAYIKKTNFKKNTDMKNKIATIKRKIKKLNEEHSKVYKSGFINYGGNMNAVRFKLSIIDEQIKFLQRELRDITNF